MRDGCGQRWKGIFLPPGLKELRDRRSSRPVTGAPACANCVEELPLKPALYRGRRVLLCEPCRKKLRANPDAGEPTTREMQAGPPPLPAPSARRPALDEDWRER